MNLRGAGLLVLSLSFPSSNQIMVHVHFPKNTLLNTLVLNNTRGERGAKTIFSPSVNTLIILESFQAPVS